MLSVLTTPIGHYGTSYNSEYTPKAREKEEVGMFILVSCNASMHILNFLFFILIRSENTGP